MAITANGQPEKKTKDEETLLADFDDSEGGMLDWANTDQYAKYMEATLNKATETHKPKKVEVKKSKE